MQPGDERLPPHLRSARCRNRAWDERTGRPDRVYVFRAIFAAAHKGAIDRFIAIAHKANDIMLRSDEEWDALRPLMNAEDDKTFDAYRDRTREGMPRRPVGGRRGGCPRACSGRWRRSAAPDLVGPSQELDPGPLLSTGLGRRVERVRDFFRWQP